MKLRCLHLRIKGQRTKESALSDPWLLESLNAAMGSLATGDRCVGLVVLPRCNARGL
jgi:hypothetical protein